MVNTLILDTDVLKVGSLHRDEINPQGRRKLSNEAEKFLMLPSRLWRGVSPPVNGWMICMEARTRTAQN